MRIIPRYLLYILLFPLIAGRADGGPYNGFDVSDALVPVSRIHQGGPPRDGIPAIDKPRFIPAGEADFLEPGARVLGLSRQGRSRAYPVAIMNWHEIVNDSVAGRNLVVSYCPLCGSGMAFSAEVAGKRLRFGVSGLLYNSDMLLYDRQTGSLWSQLMEQAISGPLKGTRLIGLALEHTTWADWRQRHPDTRVLSRDTGHRRDYDRDPYAGYADERGLYFPVAKRDPRYHPKERVLGIGLDGRYKAYPFAELSRTGGEIRDTLAGRELRIRYDREHRSAGVTDATGRPLPAVTAFWFAWYAFHPETLVYEYAAGE